MKYIQEVNNNGGKRSPSTRREWIEIRLHLSNANNFLSPSTRREWIEIVWLHWASGVGESPSTRREWIEILLISIILTLLLVSLHTEGVD